MFYKGQDTAKHIEGIIDPEIQIQPTGVDLTVNKIERLLNKGVIDFDNKKREIPPGEDIPLKNSEGNKYWELDEDIYRFTTNEKVNIPHDAVGIGMPRSSLLRCGAGLDFAFWDPGFRGRSQANLIVPAQGLILHENARVFQFALASCENVDEEYRGIYGEE